jgi:sugar phosphate isomerase/epimerase
LKSAGALFVGSAISQPDSIFMPVKNTSMPSLSVQLYTIRNEIKANPTSALRKLKEIGYDWVETAFWPEGISLAEGAKWLRDAGLKVSSAHIELPAQNLEKLMVETAAAYDCKYLIWHGWPEDALYLSAKGTKSLINIYNQAAEIAHTNGLHFGLHNHWWEFKIKNGDLFIYQILLKELNPSVFFEMDAYWVKVAGQDPVKMAKKIGDRLKFIHVKDGPARWNDQLAIDNPDPMTAVGKGTLNYSKIIHAAKGYPDWLVVEMDKTAGEVFSALKESLAYIKHKQWVS